MITLKKYNNFEHLEHLREDWDRCVLECNSPIYMSFDWCKIWWEFYGNNKQLSIFLFYAEGKIVGILPVYYEKIFYGLSFLKVCRLVGANIPPKIFNPPVKIEYRSHIIENVLQNILDAGCDLLSIGPVSDDYFPENILTNSNGNLATPYYSKINYDSYSSWELPDNFEQYLESINKTERKDFKYNFKRLNRDHSIKIETNKAFNERDFNKFLELHHIQWRKQGKLGHFNSWPNGEKFNLVLAKRQAELGRYHLLKIFKDEEVIFYGYGYKFGDRYYAQLSARSISATNKKYSLGIVGVVVVMKSLIAENVKSVEGGLGYYEYKMKLNAKLGETYIHRFVANQKSSNIKSRILEVEKKIGGFLFHKLWYRRIQPTLPSYLKQPIPHRSIKLDY